MANKSYLAATTHECALVAKRIVYAETAADGVITPGEQRMRNAVDEAEREARRTRARTSLALLLIKDTDDDSAYFERHIEACRDAA